MSRLSVPYLLSSVFGASIGDNGKEEVRFYCPKCSERKGSPDKSGHLFANIKSYKFHCVRCGYSGTVDKNLKVSEYKSYDQERDQDIEETIREFNKILDKDSDTFSLKIPMDSVLTSSSATQYLINRGFTKDQMEYYDMRVGNLSQEFGRIVIPNRVKKLVYVDTYSARTYTDQIPKYHNPSSIKKSEIVFNLHRIKERTPVILVEGALTAVAAGYHAVASLGKVLSKSQASQIVAKHPQVIYVNYDYGAEKELVNACSLLYRLDPSIPIMMTFMNDDRDAADLSHDEYSRCLERSKVFNPLLSDFEKILKR